MLHRHRFNYWSCSKFADLLRGEKKPFALGLKEWEEWRVALKSKRPFRYFLSECVLDKVQNLVLFPVDLYRTVRNWWSNRFVHKTHFLKTGLRPGVFHELDERIIHGLFNELVEFVEFDLAHANAWGENKGKYKFRKGRCPEAGVDHLLWACDLKFGEEEGFKKGDPEYGKPTPQAKSAAKILEIYKWWKEERPNRKDPMDLSGWSKVCDDEDSKKKVSSKSKKAALEKLQDIEDSYDKEDEKMLVSLIKIRKSLWT